jgi:hypothetical protein
MSARDKTLMVLPSATSVKMGTDSVLRSYSAASAKETIWDIALLMRNYSRQSPCARTTLSWAAMQRNARKIARKMSIFRSPILMTYHTIKWSKPSAHPVMHLAGHVLALSLQTALHAKMLTIWQISRMEEPAQIKPSRLKQTTSKF